MDYKAIGRKVYRLRKSMKLTQEEMAKRCNISASFLGHIERGTRVASLETFVALCNTLEVSPSYLLEYELNGNRPPKPDDMSQEDFEKVCALLNFAMDTIKGET